MAKMILSPKEARRRLGDISNSNFYENYVGDGPKKLKLVRLGPRRSGILKSELDGLIDQIVAERDQQPNAPEAE